MTNRPSDQSRTDKLGESLAALMGEINRGKSALDSLTARFVYATTSDARRELSIEQGRLQGETLSKRLALLYKVEEHWPEIIEALSARSAVVAFPRYVSEQTGESMPALLRRTGGAAYPYPLVNERAAEYIEQLEAVVFAQSASERIDVKAARIVADSLRERARKCSLQELRDEQLFIEAAGMLEKATMVPAR